MDKTINKIIYADNLKVLSEMETESIDLIYIDPPFNTKKVRTKGESRYSYLDKHSDFMKFIRDRLIEAHRVLTVHGSIYFHIDYRESHRCKLMLDDIFGEDCFLNELIWAYDYGGRPKNKWAQKHDTIFLYVKNSKLYYFNLEASDRIPYMAPGLVGKEKAARGKIPASCWWNTVVPTNGKEKTGYPTQKPLRIIKRMVAVSSKLGDTVLDFFAGSGTTGQACLELNRNFILVDNNKDAIEVMKKRFENAKNQIEYL